MKQDKKSIKSRLQNIQKEEKTIEKIGRFIKTKRGELFVTNLHRMPIKQLCEKYNAKFMLMYTSSTRNMNIIKAAINKYWIEKEKDNPPKTTPIKLPKYKIHLTKKEFKEIEARNKPKKFGFAALMHAYEEHKMNKFKKKYPLPAFKEDLFANELKLRYNTMSWIHREYVRNFLCKVYGNKQIREKYYRVFGICKNNVNGTLYEKEVDPIIIGYPLAGCNEYTDIETVKDKLRNRAKTVRSADIIELTLYNKYGKFITSMRCS